MFTESIPYSMSFAAGLFSFFSPCILPLIPAYFTFITGYSLEELTENYDAGIRKKVILSTVSYVLGFSFIFIMLGASASYIGGFANQYSSTIRIIGGILIILFGIHLTGVFRFKGLDVEKRIHVQSKPLHFFGTFLVGMAFAAGWSPCIGPALASILIIAGNHGSVGQGMILLGIYAAGLAFPFIVISIFINYLLVITKKMTRSLKWLNIAAGIVLIILGILLITNKLDLLGRLS
ncbi:MAG: cytochrome c biogenesis protein CcdA [Deltaproteobacteria bacterium]|nr:cytochrome c biogenesis protein CcdA [Deltaproteobacteria bacterium]